MDIEKLIKVTFGVYGVKISFEVGAQFCVYQKKILRFEAKKPYDFDRNKKGSALSKKEHPNTTGEKPPKFKPIKYIWLLGQ